MGLTYSLWKEFFLYLVYYKQNVTKPGSEPLKAESSFRVHEM